MIHWQRLLDIVACPQEMFDWSQQRFVSLFQRTVDVEVALNGQQYTTSRVPFIFHANWDEVTVVGVNPVHGPARGLNPVRVFGKNFMESTDLKCRFTSVYSDSTVLGVSDAIFISSTELACNTPAPSEEQWVAAGDSYACVRM